MQMPLEGFKLCFCVTFFSHKFLNKISARALFNHHCSTQHYSTTNTAACTLNCIKIGFS